MFRSFAKTLESFAVVARGSRSAGRGTRRGVSRAGRGSKPVLLPEPLESRVLMYAPVDPPKALPQNAFELAPARAAVLEVNFPPDRFESNDTRATARNFG